MNNDPGLLILVVMLLLAMCVVLADIVISLRTKITNIRAELDFVLVEVGVIKEHLNIDIMWKTLDSNGIFYTVKAGVRDDGTRSNQAISRSYVSFDGPGRKPYKLRVPIPGLEEVDESTGDSGSDRGSEERD